PPVRGRGLKPVRWLSEQWLDIVAPRAGGVD
ncbi:hypothetical protein HKBW3S34_02588, partial [Candidatus Hakubella thermalkaliphila]